MPDARYTALPFKFSATPGVVHRPGPTLGQDNDAVLGGRLGLTADELATLRADRVIGESIEEEPHLTTLRWPEGAPKSQENRLSSTTVPPLAAHEVGGRDGEDVVPRAGRGPHLVVDAAGRGRRTRGSGVAWPNGGTPPIG